MTATALVKKVLLFEDVVEQPHFNKRSFRVNKKIFGTVDEEKLTLSVKLTPEEQSVFCLYNKENINPATGKWGQQGWTVLQIKNLSAAVVTEVITLSYNNVKG